METQKTTISQNSIEKKKKEKKKTKLDKSGSLIQTILATNLQPSKQYGTVTKTAM